MIEFKQERFDEMCNYVDQIAKLVKPIRKKHLTGTIKIQGEKFRSVAVVVNDSLVVIVAESLPANSSGSYSDKSLNDSGKAVIALPLSRPNRRLRATIAHEVTHYLDDRDALNLSNYQFSESRTSADGNYSYQEYFNSESEQSAFFWQGVYEMSNDISFRFARFLSQHDDIEIFNNLLSVYFYRWTNGNNTGNTTELHWARMEKLRGNALVRTKKNGLT